jgi:hypothetical protein
MAANAMTGLLLDALESSARLLLRGGSPQHTAAEMLKHCNSLRGQRGEVRDYLGRAWEHLETVRRQPCGRGVVLA